MSLLQLQLQDNGDYWLRVHPAKGCLASFNIGSPLPHSIVGRALAAALEEQALPMETKPTYFTGTGHGMFRRGERAEVTGVFHVTPPGCTPRACFALRYADGARDFHPVSDVKNYELATE